MTTNPTPAVAQENETLRVDILLRAQDAIMGFAAIADEVAGQPPEWIKERIDAINRALPPLVAGRDSSRLALLIGWWFGERPDLDFRKALAPDELISMLDATLAPPTGAGEPTLTQLGFDILSNRVLESSADEDALALARAVSHVQLNNAAAAGLNAAFNKRAGSEALNRFRDWQKNEPAYDSELMPEGDEAAIQWLIKQLPEYNG